MRKIIVLGGAGFIGTNLCLSALRKGISVVLFDNFLRKGTDSNLDFIQKSGFGQLEVVRGDIRSIKDLEKLFEKHSDADIIFHLAGQVAVTESVRNPREDFEINALGTLNVLEVMREKGIKGLLLYASTNKVFGNLKGLEVVEEKTRYKLKDYPNGIPENYPLDFHSPYGCSKGAADQYVIDYSRMFGLKTVVFRQSCIYGYHQFGIEDQGWVAWFIIASLFDMPITIFGDGKQIRDILFVDDLIEAYWAAASAPHLHTGQVYNIGGGAECQSSLLELLEYLEKLLPKKNSIKFSEPRPGDQLVFVCDIEKSKKELGWAPRTNVELGVKLLVDWVAQNKEIFHQAGVVR